MRLPNLIGFAMLILGLLASVSIPSLAPSPVVAGDAGDMLRAVTADTTPLADLDKRTLRQRLKVLREAIRGDAFTDDERKEARVKIKAYRAELKRRKQPAENSNNTEQAEAPPEDQSPAKTPVEDASAQRGQDQPPPTQTVVSNGIGDSPQAAAKNAAENALTQVVGTFIDSDTLLRKRTDIENGVREESREIQTNIREYSQGSIKSFDILDTSTQNGLVRVTARVEVRIEDFKVFVAKLARSESSVPADIYPKGETQKRNRESGENLIFSKVLLPIAEGKATEFIMGKPQVYSEWEHTLTDEERDTFRDLLDRMHAPTETVVIPIDVTLNGNFLKNAVQTLDAISFGKKRSEDPEQPCYEPLASAGSNFDFNRDGALAIAGIGNLIQVYLIKGVRHYDQPGDSASPTQVFKDEIFHDPKGFLIRARNGDSILPDLEVTILDATNTTLEQFLITRQNDFSSHDGRAFSDQGWGTLSGVGQGGGWDCPMVWTKSKMHLFLNVSTETLAQMKKISVRMTTN